MNVIILLDGFAVSSQQLAQRTVSLWGTEASRTGAETSSECPRLRTRTCYPETRTKGRRLVKYSSRVRAAPTFRKWWHIVPSTPTPPPVAPHKSRNRNNKDLLPGQQHWKWKSTNQSVSKQFFVVDSKLPHSDVERIYTDVTMTPTRSLERPAYRTPQNWADNQNLL